ncbi:hypothetical protein GWK48_03570 [Metallosphaera tengchongensis]|uniref:Uncharacterized protein n=1 Tax=Metallosphaera tengchongensis TaxID=1532350 RepID=A0A6N0NVP9_9CREN|nr:hypothetical protein GWK48_03570 [Metallosphaera tengchongensis]
MVAGVVMALSLAYVSILIGSMSFYPFHDRFQREDLETGISLDNQHKIVFYPAMGFEGTYNFSLNDTMREGMGFYSTIFCHESTLNVSPREIYASPNSTLTFTIGLGPGGFVHIVGDNGFYSVDQIQENVVQGNVYLNVTLTLRNVPPGTLWIPVWDSCRTVYVEVVVS